MENVPRYDRKEKKIIYVFIIDTCPGATPPRQWTNRGTILFGVHERLITGSRNTIQGPNSNRHYELTNQYCHLEP